MTQEPTTENEQKTTSRTWQGAMRSSGMDVRTVDEPHYVVITGTNIRSTLPGKDFTPKVYDSEAIAQAAIDAENKHRKHMTDRAITPKSPISAEEYDRKYSTYQNIPKE